MCDLESDKGVWGGVKGPLTPSSDSADPIYSGLRLSGVECKFPRA